VTFTKNSPTPSFFFISSYPLPRTISTGLIVPPSHMNTQYFHHIHSSFTLSLCSSPLLLAPTPRQDLYFAFCPSFLKKIFLFVYGGYIGSLIVTFPYIHVLYPNLVHSLHCSPFYLSAFLMVILTGLSVLYSY
jgi:hypothetical protein